METYLGQKSRMEHLVPPIMATVEGGRKASPQMLMSRGLPAEVRLPFHWRKQQKVTATEVDDQTTVLRHIGVLALNEAGIVVFCNAHMLEILAKAKGRPLSGERLVGQHFEDVMGVPLSKTLIGYSLTRRDEARGWRIRVGDRCLMMNTLLLWGPKRQLRGCIGYYIPDASSPTISDDADDARFIVEKLVRERGYPTTDWIANISLEHALQLYKCLMQNGHFIPNPRYCVFANQCAFNPECGFLSLDRRRFHRAPVELPVRIFMAATPDGQAVDGIMDSKFCEGRTIDLSLGGARLRAPVNFPLGTVLRVEVDQKELFGCQGEIVWSKEIEAGHWDHGLRFLTLGRKERAKIMRLVSFGKPSQAPMDSSPSSPHIVSPVDGMVVQAVALILRFLKAKDIDTFTHSLRTAHIATQLGTALHLPKHDIVLLRHGALLHDLGKLEIDPALLKSTSVLGPEQRAILRKHPVYGARLLEGYPPLRSLSLIVRHHHERHDGKGYPDGLSGEEIPFLSRILAVADSIDAMAHSRPYRPTPLTGHQIIEILGQEIGHQFDEIVARVAIQLLSEGKLIGDV